MIIAFEGMDGVGKTTIADGVSKKLGISHSEQNLIDIMEIKSNDFGKLVRFVRKSNNKKLSFIFYTLRCMIDNQYDSDLIVERSMVSTYYFEHNNVLENDFDFAMKLGVVPNITFLLYASSDVRKERITARNPNDSDLTKAEALQDGYGIMRKFIQNYSIPCIEIDTEKLNCDQVIEICSSIICEYKNIPMEYYDDFFDYYNGMYSMKNNKKEDEKVLCRKKKRSMM